MLKITSMALMIVFASQILYCSKVRALEESQRQQELVELVKNYLMLDSYDTLQRIDRVSKKIEENREEIRNTFDDILALPAGSAEQPLTAEELETAVKYQDELKAFFDDPQPYLSLGLQNEQIKEQILKMDEVLNEVDGNAFRLFARWIIILIKIIIFIIFVIVSFLV